jgi:hypothetical protein
MCEGVGWEGFTCDEVVLIGDCVFKKTELKMTFSLFSFSNYLKTTFGIYCGSLCGSL